MICRYVRRPTRRAASVEAGATSRLVLLAAGPCFLRRPIAAGTVAASLFAGIFLARLSAGRLAGWLAGRSMSPAPQPALAGRLRLPAIA